MKYIELENINNRLEEIINNKIMRSSLLENPACFLKDLNIENPKSIILPQKTVANSNIILGAYRP